MKILLCVVYIPANLLQPGWERWVAYNSTQFPFGAVEI